MNRAIPTFTLFVCAAAWACSSADETSTSAKDTPATIPAEQNSAEPAPLPDGDDGDDVLDDDADAGATDAASSNDGGDGGATSDAGPKPNPDAAVDVGSIGCVLENESNDGAAQQMPRSLCGKLTAGDLDRFYIEGRKDEPIEVVFSADGDALVSFRTNAGLSEVFFGKSFKATVKPGDRKLFVDIGMAKASVAYHVAFERK